MTLVERVEESEAIGDDGYRRIRADIVFGRLRPGQKLKLDGLKESYGVSVSTLREILSRLTSEGLVLAEGRRGFEVAPVSIDNLKELADLRLLLEGHAMEASFARADMEWEGRIVAAHHKLAATERLMSSKIGEPDQWKRYDSEFHQELISNCGSRTLMEAHAAARGRTRQSARTIRFVARPGLPILRPAAGKITVLPEVGGLQVPPAIYSRPAIVVRVRHAT